MKGLKNKLGLFFYFPFLIFSLSNSLEPKFLCTPLLMLKLRVPVLHLAR